MANIRSPRGTFWSVSFGHLAVDMFSGMAPLLLTFLRAHLISMTNTQIGLAVSAFQLTGALSQPFFGWIGDRNGGRFQGAGGVAWTVSLLAVSLVVAQVTRSYTLMLIPYILAALGSGAFHPVGAMHASEAQSHRATTNTSVFFLMGQLGLAIGPALAGFLLDRYATHNAFFTQALGPVYADALFERGTIAPILVLALFVIPAVVFMAFSLPSSRLHTERRLARAQATASEAANTIAFSMSAFLLLGLVVALRSIINPGAAAFIPRLFQLKGWSATEYGFVTSAFWLGGGIAGVIVGKLADRHDSRYLIAATLILSAPAMILMTTMDGPVALVLALAVGALSGASHSVLVVQAQALLPGRKGLASGSILGFMFATGALGSLLIGTLSDRIGLPAAFQIVGGITVVTGLLGLALPAERTRPKTKRAPSPEPETAISGAD